MSNLASPPSARTSEPPKSGKVRRAARTKAGNAKPTREQIATELEDSGKDLGSVEHPLSKLDEVIYELGVAWYAAAAVEGEIGTDLQMMLAQVRGRIRDIHNTLTLERPASGADAERENLGGLVDETREHAKQLGGLFASVDAELDGELLGGSGTLGAERRLAFNRALGGVVAGLDCIEQDHVTAKAVCQ